MKLLKVSLCAAAATFLMAGAASADVSVNVGAATDYVFRGIDQTGALSEGQVFGGADWTQDAFYAGVWVTNSGPDFDDGIEYDVYGGWKPSFSGINLDIGLIFYGYNSSELGTVSDDFNTLEVKVAGSVPIGMGSVGAAVYWTDDQAGSDESQTYIELNGSFPFREATISGAIGRVDCDCLVSLGGHDQYTTWNAGITFPVTENFSIDARYIGSDSKASDAFGTSAFDGFVGTLKATF
jgi:uncharacterized protein (TIGR02001 family)